MSGFDAKLDHAPVLALTGLPYHDLISTHTQQDVEVDHVFMDVAKSWELGQRLRDDAVVTCDSGTVTTWWARQIPARRGQLHSVSATLASMANGVPYAIAAQIAFPERPVVAFVGDGGFSMLMAELATCVKYRLPVKVVVVKNNTLGQIKWEQMQPGFRSYTVVRTGDHEIVAITVFDSESQLAAAVAAAAELVRGRVRPLAIARPDRRAGPVLHHHAVA